MSRHILVVGGGIGGMSAAIGLRQKGMAVTLIDADPEWKVVGAGITISGPTLRAFKQLGILDAVRSQGFMSDAVHFHQADGTLIRTMPTPTLEADIPPAGGILRPVLHHILSDRVKMLGADIRLGVTVSAMEDDGAQVRVDFSDGSSGRYDAVIGADGYQSATRRLILPDAPAPAFVGQGCWRVLAPRPASVQGAQIYFGPGYKVGVNPCSADSLYLFCTLAMPGNPFIPQSEWLDRVRDILAPFGGSIATIREGLGPQSEVNYRPLEALLLPLPWHVGRIGLIGDAIHATTPHLASGAGLAVEDGVLLAEILATESDIERAWTAWEQRRWERCRVTLENSLRISALEIEGGHDAEVARIMAESVAILAQPM
ncbi:FAD-dependent monooxygenase [Sphingobium sp. HBC34]|uniref:FAD-dependent monooxygenase n=1 Tax=Sphingobium cyanobacteriorum TaxID=3063954 RepID=A0ABT8ZNU8_9SPHN|nr:FAD-dependent monooxygenase [Sphingobium sp. HBC34]MDO7836146.1 FAD-dependent monooxygenase [Sphingobium sp. HBC34]